MHASNPKEDFRKRIAVLERCVPDDWDDIAALLDQVVQSETAPIVPPCDNPLQSFTRGVAFLTFSYGVDGVSIEIIKTARALGALLSSRGEPSIHLIGESFDAKAEPYLNPGWQKFQIEGIDGWDKWDEGRWFAGLFKQEMESHSDESNLLAREIFRQAVTIAGSLGEYLVQNQVSLLMPVNIASNPGNLALTLGLILAAEILGVYVLNMNHDYYWEGGKPPSERDPGEPPGVRDHFFHNMDNRSFFSLFERLYPWNGKHWLQVNINARQSRILVERYGFSDERVAGISTTVDDAFFRDFGREDVVSSRLRMAHILSDGEAVLRPVGIDEHLSRLTAWMVDQQPIIVGSRPGLTVDPRAEDLIVLLQPTRIVRRKRIERDLELVEALLRRSKLGRDFEDNPNRQLILHITGPTPREHQEDLERVLEAYRDAVRALPKSMAERIFIAFSVGQETHPSFAAKGFTQLAIDAIYRMADAVVFPSETEGRGLPIIESSACGIPIVCSRYHPQEVFGEVVGEGLPDAHKIRYTMFPEGEFSDEFLTGFARVLTHPEEMRDTMRHNRAAVRARYSQAAFTENLQRLLQRLCKLD